MVDQYGMAYLNVAEVATVSTTNYKAGDFSVVASSTAPTLSKISLGDLAYVNIINAVKVATSTLTDGAFVTVVGATGTTVSRITLKEFVDICRVKYYNEN